MRFVVLSDLHLPNPRHETAQIIAAVVALQPRFVAIVGDFTNGSDKRDNADPSWWRAVGAALEPLRAAKIPILPVAGNHDSYFARQRAGYATMFADLAGWMAPLAALPARAGDTGLAAAPFSYAVEVDGVHFAFAHIVGGQVDHAVQHWLADDLAGAATARLRVILGHVPMTSINGARRRNDELGKLAAAGHAELLVMGHEHLVWDEDVALPGGALIRQLVVGCTSGFYNYSPSPDSRKRAHCTATSRHDSHHERCAMPHGGGAFELALGRKDRMLQHAAATFTVVTIDGTTVDAQPMTVDASGKPVAFYLP